MKLATLQRLILPPNIPVADFIAEHGARNVAPIEDDPGAVRLLRPWKLVPMSEEEASEFVKGPRLLPCPAAPPRPFSFHGFALLPLLVSLSLITFGAATGWGAGVGVLPTRGEAWAALPLAEMKLSGNEIGLGVIGLIAALIGYHFTIGRYIRQQAGVKESHGVEINGQPVHVKGDMTTSKAPRWATWDEVETLRKDLAGLRTEGAKRDAEMRGFVDEKFHALSRERSVSIARLHEKVEASAGALGHEIDTKVDGVRREIHDMPGKLVTLLQQTGAIGGKRS